MTDVSAFGGFSNALRAHLEDEFLKTSAVIFPILDRAPLDANHVRFHIVQYTQKADNTSGVSYTSSFQWSSLSAELTRAYEPIHTHQYASGLAKEGLGRISDAKGVHDFLIFWMKDWDIHFLVALFFIEHHCSPHGNCDICPSVRLVFCS